MKNELYKISSFLSFENCSKSIVLQQYDKNVRMQLTFVVNSYFKGQEF